MKKIIAERIPDEESPPQRQRFHVNISTNTCVSWEQLLKDNTSRPEGATGAGVHDAAVAAGSTAAQGHRNLSSIIDSSAAASARDEVIARGGRPLGQGYETDSGTDDDDPSAREEVIAIIEKLYQGGRPQNLGYETDSGIDDEELDEYYEDENDEEKIKTKYTGYYINKGPIEGIHDSSNDDESSDDSSNGDEMDSDKMAGDEMHADGHVTLKNPHTIGKMDGDGIDGDDKINGKSNNGMNLKRKDPPGGPPSKSSKKPRLSVTPSSAPEVSMSGPEVSESDSERTESDEDLPRASKTAEDEGDALLELEKLVNEFAAQCEVPGANPDEQAKALKTKRLPPAIMNKLAEVAKEVGEFTEELLQRLMRSVGRFINERTIRKHLRMHMGDSERFREFLERIKEMVDARISASQINECSENSVENAEGGNQAYEWDEATEDLVCEFYDFYVLGKDVSQRKASDSKKLYTKVAELWPQGWMSNGDIKNAVARAQKRKRAEHKHKKRATKQKQTSSQ